MKIGIDFDNTIICYDTVFNKVGEEKGLIPEGLSLGKGFVRDYLRKINQEDKWTELQGYVYGTKLADATIYKGVKEFFKFCKTRNIECIIVSHKTRYPYVGKKYNLHKAAMEWINKQNLDVDVFFETTKHEKVRKISDLGCSFFIDDLPEFLLLSGFSEKIVKILFDPLNNHCESNYRYQYANSWDEILSMVQNE